MSASAVIDPVSDPRWDALVARHGGSLFATARWLDAVSGSYGFEPRASVSVAHHELTGGLPYVQLDDIRGRRVAVFPFSDFCEPFVADIDDWRRIVEPLLGHGPVTMRWREGCAPPVGDDGFDRSVHHFWHATSIVAGLDDDERFARLDPRFRQSLRRARRAGVEVSIASDAAQLRAFYDLHVATRLRKHRLLPQPYRFFERLRATFGDDLLVALAHHGGRTLAGIVFLASGDSLYYKYNASDVTADLTVRPNELLLWEGMRLAARRGWKRIDLGISAVDQPDLVRYKRKVGDEERPVVTLLHDGPGGVAGPGIQGLWAAVDALVLDDGVGPAVARRVASVRDAGRREMGRDGVEGLLGDLAEALIGDECDPVLAERAAELLYGYFS